MTYNISNNINNRVVDLGFILHQFPNFNFNVNSSKGRLGLQRFVYLLQSFDIYLGYDFAWYSKNGPYDVTLSAVGFALDTIYHKIPDKEYVKFHQDEKQENFERFKEFMLEHAGDDKYIEVVSLIHFWDYITPIKDVDRDMHDIIDKVSIDTKQDKDKCMKIFQEMRRWNL